MSADSDLKTFALVGAPNSGKTTLYNWLTNSKFKTVNYPGATVEYFLGQVAPQWQAQFQVVDTPGVYSLQPKSADEVVTLKVLYDNPEVGRVHGVIVVVDGTQLSRHLLLAEQIKETGFPMVLAITMSDLLRKEKIEIDKEYLAQAFACQVVTVDGLLGSGIQSLTDICGRHSLKETGKKTDIWNLEKHELKQADLELVAKKALRNDPVLSSKMKNVSLRTRKIDAVLMHPFLGLISFIAIMTLLFSSIFWLAQPFMDGIDQIFSTFGQSAALVIGENILGHFVGDGLITGVGAVLVFVPQIFILFFGISALESSGYLARAATIIDKPFSKLGMSGRSFVPVLSGFACAVPAIIASRNIPSARDRWITNFIIPLMTCSARLPVYALLLAFIFKNESAWKPGLVLAAIYIVSVIIGALAAWIVNKFLPQKETSFFMMELPLYRKPRLQVIFRQSLDRTYSYIKKAGPVILVLSVIIWGSSYFPNYKLQDPQQKLEQSYLGQVGHYLEPIFKPMGSDWRVGIGLISAFAAREVFVSSLAIVFNVTDSNEETLQDSLLENMRVATFSDGSKIFTGPSITALIIFFMIALQCMSTVAIAAKETNSWRFALTQLAVFNLVAYLLAVGVFQFLKYFISFV